MKYPIGFRCEVSDTAAHGNFEINKKIDEKPVKSLVDVRFANRNMTLSYYNDRFDLNPGDLVYVDGKMEGQIGYVVNVNHHFKIKLSDYKRVIAKIDTQVQGSLSLCGSHMVSFDREVIPYSTIITWFKAPNPDEEEYVTGSDGDGFLLEDLSSMNITREIAERGHDYYTRNKVRYLCVDGVCGKAIVEGSETYELEFEYVDGEVRNLVCSCYCAYHCKHEFAAMLQLRETLEKLTKHYDEQYARTGYFAALAKGAFIQFVLDRHETGTIIVE